MADREAARDAGSCGRLGRMGEASTYMGVGRRRRHLERPAASSMRLERNRSLSSKLSLRHSRATKVPR
jgi:hypothetical protein